jgi:ribosome-binding protein aMBF1 (putative translation factor)
MTAKKTFKSPALRYTYDRTIKGKSERETSYEAELANVEVASLLYELRTKAGLSQRELAKLVSTTASVICRLEDADYEGHSMAMLKRIAEALNKWVEIRLVSLRPPKARSASHEQSLSL